MAAPAAAGVLHPGLRLGVGVTNFRGDFADLAEPEASTGFVAGPFVTWEAAPHLGLQAELLYVRKGATATVGVLDGFGDISGTTKAHWVLDYLEIPLLVRVTPAPALAFAPYLIAGPTLGFPLRGRLEDEFVGARGDLENLKPVDVGLAGGVGAVFHAGRIGMALEARYTGGLTDLYDIDGNYESRNSAFTFTAAVFR